MKTGRKHFSDFVKVGPGRVRKVWKPTLGEFVSVVFQDGETSVCELVEYDSSMDDWFVVGIPGVDFRGWITTKNLRRLLD